MNNKVLTTRTLNPHVDNTRKSNNFHNSHVDIQRTIPREREQILVLLLFRIRVSQNSSGKPK